MDNIGIRHVRHFRHGWPSRPQIALIFGPAIMTEIDDDGGRGARREDGKDRHETEAVGNHIFSMRNIYSLCKGQFLPVLRGGFKQREQHTK